MMNRLLKIFITLSVLTIVFAFSAPTADAQDKFTGTWKLNRELSDKPGDKFISRNGQATDENPLKSAELIRAPLVKPFPLTETLKTYYNEPEFKVELEFKGLDQAIQAASGEKLALPIGKDGNPVRVILPFSPARVFYTDGRVVKQELHPGKTIEIKAERTDSKIVVAEELPFGGKAVQTFEFSPDGKQLFVTLQIENQEVKEKPSPIRFVYDRRGN